MMIDQEEYALEEILESGEKVLEKPVRENSYLEIYQYGDFLYSIQDGEITCSAYWPKEGEKE